MSASAQIQKLIQIPIFRGLSEKEAAGVLDIAEETAAKQGATLFSEGDQGDSLYVLLEGSVDVQKKDSKGAQQSLAKLTDGAVLGEMSLISGNAPRSASAVVEKDVKALKIGAARFQQLLKQDNLAALKIVHNLAQVMSRRLLLMDEKLVDLVNAGRKKEELADFQKILSNWSF